MTKHLLLTTLVGISALYVTGCESTRFQRGSRQREGGFRPPPTQTEEPIREPSSSEPSTSSRRREPQDEPAPSTNTPPPSTQEPVKTGDLPYAKGVAGKPGFVTSPFAPAAGYIDVRGFPPGTEVKDPYSGKTFLVP
jgi:hypothetical protein